MDPEGPHWHLMNIGVQFKVPQSVTMERKLAFGSISGFCGGFQRVWQVITGSLCQTTPRHIFVASTQLSQDINIANTCRPPANEKESISYHRRIDMKCLLGVCIKQSRDNTILLYWFFLSSVTLNDRTNWLVYALTMYIIISSDNHLAAVWH